jgi:hypothetical protein
VMQSNPDNKTTDCDVLPLLLGQPTGRTHGSNVAERPDTLGRAGLGGSTSCAIGFSGSSVDLEKRPVVSCGLDDVLDPSTPRQSRSAARSLEPDTPRHRA